MSERVRAILGRYGRDNPGRLINLARILNHGRLAGTGRMVILPVEQGFGMHSGGGIGSIIGHNAFQRKKTHALELLSAIMNVYAGEEAPLRASV